MVYYSSSTNGFYISEIHSDAIPADAVEITAARHAELLTAQSAGFQIQPGPDGAPVTAKPVAAVPRSVRMVQARLALLEAGLYDQVETAILALPTEQRTAAQIEWEFRPTVERDSPLVALLGSALALDVAALDRLFVKAATL